MTAPPNQPTDGVAAMFLLGMKKVVVPPQTIEPDTDVNSETGSPEITRPVLNVGAGEHNIPHTIPVDHPDVAGGGLQMNDNHELIRIGWNADAAVLPLRDGSVAGIHAYHFLEHVLRPVDVLMEFQRVLRPGGLLNIGVPHAMCQMAVNDLDHKCFFTERSFDYALHSPHYTKHSGRPWKMEILTQFIMGIEWRYMMLFVQLRKRDD